MKEDVTVGADELVGEKWRRVTCTVPDEPEAVAPSVRSARGDSGVFPASDTAPRFGDLAFALHDARNMAMVLSANMEFVAASVAGDPRRDVVHAVRDMQESVCRLAELLGGALAASRDQARSTAVVKIAPTVTRLLARFGPQAAVRGLRFAVEGDPATRASIDAQLLERVVGNLLDNALRFAPAHTTIEVSYEMRGDMAVVTVADEGPGVPESSREAIFSSYIGRDPADGGGHFGLGLAFCREVARSHGGDVWVLNRSSGGACFVVEIVTGRGPADF